jgi:carboxyl-terminal processing protease
MNRITRTLVLILSLAAFTYAAVGYALRQTNEDRAYRALGVFTEVLQRIQHDYVEEPNLPLVTTGAMRGLLESLDPLSSYLSPNEYAEYKRFTEKPPRGEIGAALSKRFGYVIVLSVLPNSPAEKAGLRPGDVLESIASFTTREMSVGQAQALLAGEPGTSVKVSVVRRARAEPLEVFLTRAEVPIPAAASSVIKEPDVPAGGEIVYLKLYTLTPGKSEEVREKLAQFERQGLRKLILDLRECSLGNPAEGIALARLFVHAGTITTLRGQTVAPQTYAADPAKVVWKHPVAVLISSSTAGAAEIAAAAILETGRGQLVGERTFGSASEQKVLPLEDGAALILTVANYYSPGGKSIPEEGVKPSVEVASQLEDSGDLLEPTEPGVPPPPESPTARPDEVLKRAIELMRAPAGGLATPAKS